MKKLEKVSDDKEEERIFNIDRGINTSAIFTRIDGSMILIKILHLPLQLLFQCLLLLGQVRMEYKNHFVRDSLKLDV